MATILELAELSDLVYGGSTAVADVAGLGGVAANAATATATGAKWTLLTTSLDPSNSALSTASQSAGYYGAAYLNNVTGEIVIANRGTRPTSLIDLLNDAKLAAGIKTPAQDAAAAFAVLIADQYGGPIIETGHSLGGNDAQAAVVALTSQGVSVSAVTFNSPGIGGYTIPAGVSPSSYNVQNLYDQGDAIHSAGGTQLGSPPILLPAGPSTASLAWGAPAAVALGPVGLVVLFGDALYDVLGPAHSIKTIITYLQTPQGIPLGSTGWSATGPSVPLSSGATGTSTGPTMTVNAAGALVLADANGNSVTISASADKQNINAVFSGSSSPIFQQLASLGTVTMPAAELNQVVTGLTSASTINETITSNSNNTIDVVFQNSATPNGDQFKVTATNPASAFNYFVPTNAQSVIETINNSGNNVSGSVSVITNTNTTQLVGGTASPTQGNTWTDSNGDQYQFVASATDLGVGTLTIKQGMLGTTGNQAINPYSLCL